jgi:hypothetical protein
VDALVVPLEAAATQTIGLNRILTTMDVEEPNPKTVEVGEAVVEPVGDPVEGTIRASQHRSQLSR